MNYLNHVYTQVSRLKSILDANISRRTLIIYKKPSEDKNLYDVVHSLSGVATIICSRVCSLQSSIVSANRLGVLSIVFVGGLHPAAHLAHPQIDTA